jgi:hypothetical protein
VVTPTLKAAQLAAAEVGTATGSAAWLAYQHGWRWTDHGAWTQLAAGPTDPHTGAGSLNGFSPRRRISSHLAVDDVERTRRGRHPHPRRIRIQRHSI